MHTIKYLDTTDIEKVHKTKKKLKVGGEWLTIWYDSLDDLFINLNEHKEGGYPDVANIPQRLIDTHSLQPLYR